MLLAALLCTSVPAAAFASEEEYFPEDGVPTMEEDDLKAGEDIAMEEERPVYEEEEELGEARPDLPELTMDGVSEEDGENPLEGKEDGKTEVAGRR